MKILFMRFLVYSSFFFAGPKLHKETSGDLFV